MTFLDTVDGKLARVTLTSSKIGNLFDHGIDLIHPPFWWFAWWVGCQQLGLRPPHPQLAVEVMIIGYVVQRVIEGIFMRRFGFHVHSWRPFDSWFRLITARRNPNLLILTPAWIPSILNPALRRVTDCDQPGRPRVQFVQARDAPARRPGCRVDPRRRHLEPAQPRKRARAARPAGRDVSTSPEQEYCSGPLHGGGGRSWSSRWRRRTVRGGVDLAWRRMAAT